MDSAPNLWICVVKNKQPGEDDLKMKILYSSLPTNLLSVCRSNAVRRHKQQPVGFSNTFPWCKGSLENATHCTYQQI